MTKAGQLRHLIVYAHFNKKSFNHAILDVVREEALQHGHDLVVHDLYLDGFAPVLGSWDSENLAKKGVPGAHAKEAQDLVRWAEHMTFIYPLWWTGFPAILKGWFDRVLSYDFAYSIGPDGVEGLLKGKSVLAITTHGTPKAIYEESGMYHALKMTQDVGVFEFCGMTMKDHLFFAGVGPSMTQEQAEEYLAAARRAVAALHG